jgi:signal transduction histidine kinase/ActR/RegA family two-component response regulator
MCRLLAVLSAPAGLFVALSPGPLRPVDRALVLCAPAAVTVVAILSRNARRTRPFAAFFVGALLVTCLGFSARTGLMPGIALGLGTALVLAATFLGTRAVWWTAATTTLAIAALAIGNRTGVLHPIDPAAMLDWRSVTTWAREAIGYVATMAVAASAVRMVISHLEESVRERDRLLVAERQAIAAERRARVQVSALQRATTELSRATTAREVVEVACRVGSVALNGVAGVVWMLDGDGALHLSGSWGPNLEYLEHFRVIREDSAMPAQHVVRTRQPFWVETEQQFRAASEELHDKAVAAGRVSAYGVLPLAVNGVVKGVIAFSQPTGHQFDVDERAYYATLAIHCSLALERAALLDSARESAARAEAANRLKDQFLSTVSHELRTPLTAITGWVSILRSGMAPPDRRDHALEVIERNARAQATLIGDLLDMSRITAGSLRLNVAPIEPAIPVQMAIDAVRPAADARAVRLEAQLDGAGLVLGDAGRLQQIVSNLLTNAVKFSPSGGRVDVALGREASDVTIAVRDLGEGIEREFLPHLFEPFRQADASFARPHGGLGLGLTITKRLVELHGGTIQAHSDGAGRGATFIVRLPCTSRSLDATSEPPRERALATAGERRLTGLRVLLVEDEPDTREVLLALFDASGARASATSSAAEALEQFHRERPDIIVSDIGLRGEDGLALIRKVRRMSGGADVPAVALTAFARAEDRAAVLAAGFDAHLAKPIEPERLLHDVARLLRDRSGREANVAETHY